MRQFAYAVVPDRGSYSTNDSVRPLRRVNCLSAAHKAQAKLAAAGVQCRVIQWGMPDRTILGWSLDRLVSAN